MEDQTMLKFTQKELKRLVQKGYATDITHAKDKNVITEPYSQIGYSIGTYGINGVAYVGIETQKLYVITARTTAIFVF
jgi:hypothetical protein